MSQNFTVVARNDGRGGIKPFNSYGAKQAGAKVNIGGRMLTVTKDGRVNIPKDIMEKYGILNSDGRRVINIQFGTQPSKDGKEWWKEVFTEIKRPDKSNKEKKTGEVAQKQVIGKGRKTLKSKEKRKDKRTGKYKPSDVSDRTWNTND